MKKLDIILSFGLISTVLLSTGCASTHVVAADDQVVCYGSTEAKGFVFDCYKAKDRMIDIDFPDASFREIFSALANLYDVRISIPKSISEKKATLHLKDVSFQNAVLYVVRDLGVSVEFAGHDIVIKMRQK